MIAIELSHHVTVVVGTSFTWSHYRCSEIQPGVVGAMDSQTGTHGVCPTIRYTY